MKCIIKLDGQIAEGDRCFAVYCTVRDRFDSYGGSQTWDTADELDADFERDANESAAALRVLDLSDGAGLRHLEERRDLRVRVVALARSAGY